VKYYLLLIIISQTIFGFESSAQKKFFTRTGQVVFFSKAPLEDIKAVNKQASCVYDAGSNRIVAKVLIKAFEFDKSLMQKHFNENYLESDKYPKASFKGKINVDDKLNFEKDLDRQLEFEGNLTIHGITKKIKGPFNFSIKKGVMSIQCNFYIQLKDYEIKIPTTVINNISGKVKIDVNLKMHELKK
jgi:hypothetical protein